MQASGLGNKSNNNIDMIMYNDTTAKKKNNRHTTSENVSVNDLNVIKGKQ